MQPEQLTAGGQPPRFSLNIETILLIERIKKMGQGDLVTYGELAELIGQDVQREARHTLLSARRICQREYQVVTDAERNIGIRRLTDVELTSSGLKIFSGLRRAAKRGIDRVTAVADFDTLPDEEKVRHNATISGLALIRMLSRPKSIDRIAAATNTTNTGQLPVGRTLELFRGPKVVR
jgi:hypothetical protein